MALTVVSVSFPCMFIQYECCNIECFKYPIEPE
jgi:hypothetical protein